MDWGEVASAETIVAPALLAGSLLAAALYGFRLVGRPPSLARTAWKTTAVALLAMLALFAMAMELAPDGSGRASICLALAAALALCALGDAFLAADPERGLQPGLISFLLGHLVYIGLFIWMTSQPALGPAALAAILAVVIVAGGMLAWLWRGLGVMRWPVTGYLAVISAMTVAAIVNGQPALIAGAVLFMASDAILAGQLFRGARLLGSDRLTNWAIWFLYYAAQITLAFGVLARVPA